MSRLLFLLAFLFLSGCQSVAEQEVAVNKRPTGVEAPPAPISAEAIEASEAAFESLISKAITDRFIAIDDYEAMTLIQRFFPNTSRFQNHPVSIEPIAARDSFWLLLYEFISEKDEKSQMFLGSFHKTGNVVDLLEIQSVSYDGHISLSLLEEDILEIEYEDFLIRSNFPNIQANTDDYNPLVLPVRSKSNSNRGEETAGEKYYRIQSDGTFEALATSNQKHIARVFPQVSSRILSVEELKRLKPDELKMMRNEMYACHGFIFEDELLTAFFKEKDWYQPITEIDLAELTEIERINLNRMLNLN